MSVFTTYNTIVEQKLANNSEVFFTSEMKRQAANEVTKEIVQQYDLPELIRRPSTSGTLIVASGVAAFPSDYFRLVKFWLEDSDNIESAEFIYIRPEEFDGLSDTAAYFWTEDYDPSDDTRKFFFKPTTETAIHMRYIQQATEMTTDSTDNGLSSQWDDIIGFLTVARLLQNAGRYDEAQFFENTGNARLRDVYGSVKNPGGVKQNARFRSKYERRSQLW